MYQTLGISVLDVIAGHVSPALTLSESIRTLTVSQQHDILAHAMTHQVLWSEFQVHDCITTLMDRRHREVLSLLAMIERHFTVTYEFASQIPSQI